MKTNTKAKPTLYTHEGAIARRLTPYQELRRSVMACLLWEDSFYEDGESIAARIEGLVPKVNPADVYRLAIDARTKMKLRHVPLHLAMSLLRAHQNAWAGLTLAEVIQRPDELTEALSLYWGKGKKTPIAHAVKSGLAKAFTKFTEYQLQKYNRDEKVKLRDVMFLTHPKPKDDEQAAVWKKLAEGKLETPDTWEVKLSEAHSNAEKKAVWDGLLERKHLGAMALLRNLRNMQKVGVSTKAIKTALENMKVERVLPFRFLTAARYAPTLEGELEGAMFRCLEGREKLPGQTVLIVDVSGSMKAVISAKSEVTRLDTACGLAILLREIAEEAVIIAFSMQVALIPARRGMALRDCIVGSMDHASTMTALAIATAHQHYPKPERIILITDEQSHQIIQAPWAEKAYVINVGVEKNGIGYGKWIHLDGWSEQIVEWIREYERETFAKGNEAD